MARRIPFAPRFAAALVVVLFASVIGYHDQGPGGAEGSR